MKLIYLVQLALALPLNSAYAALPGAVPSVTVSAPGANTGQVSIPPSDLAKTTAPIFSIYAGGALTTPNFYVFYKNGSIYSVSSTTKAYCFDITASASVASLSFQFASTQTSFSTGAVSISSGTYQCGATNVACQVAGATTFVPAVIPGVYTFGDGAHVTYPALQPTGGSTPIMEVHMDCFEQ